MKNFPHQINQIPKLTRALATICELNKEGLSALNDGLLGDALAEAGVYSFRTNYTNVSDALKAEHRKPVGSQGARTCARDLRRFFFLANLIGDDATLTKRGLDVLSAPDHRTANDRWRQALLRISLGEGVEKSHPYRILLRLVATLGRLPKPYAGLCLEAANDSIAEFDRVLEIARRPNPNREMGALAGAHMARNSIKILPALALQVGDLTATDTEYFVSELVRDQMQHSGYAPSKPRSTSRILRRTRKARNGRNTRRRPLKGSTLSVEIDPDQLSARFNAHEECLDQFVALLPPDTVISEANYDLAVHCLTTEILLVEAKTIRNDAYKQARLALGQLKFYLHFDVNPAFPGRRVMPLTLFDQHPSAEVVDFLELQGIASARMLNNKLSGSSLARTFLRVAGVNIK